VASSREVIKSIDVSISEMTVVEPRCEHGVGRNKPYPVGEVIEVSTL
jgi:hypothetical protein